MKKILAFFLAMSAPMLGQATNPQNTFPNAVQSIGPSFYLNYNDLTSSFKDSVSGLTMGFSPLTSAAVPATMPTSNGNGSLGYASFSTTQLTPGTFSSVNVQLYSVPTAGQPLTIVMACGTAPALTITQSWTVSLAAVTTVQNFTTTPFTIGAGCYAGWWVATGGGKGVAHASSGSNYFLSASSSLPSGAQTYSTGAGAQCIQFVIAVPAGTIATQQPGFDYTNNAQYSAGFPYNTWSVAPNNTLGAVDWNTPFSMMWQIDRLNWNRKGTLVLSSKGDISSDSNNWWKLTLAQSGYYAKFCFYANAGVLGQPQGVCANSLDAPNGFGYNVVVTNTGTGGNGVTGSGSTNAFQIYVNGINESVVAASYGQGFGLVTLALSGSGTGYANSTPFTSTGGGVNCTVTGTMTSVSGVPSSATTTTSQPNYGCTSAPTITLTAPTGTGTTVIATLAGTSMNATTYPVMAPGYVSGGGYNGIDGTDDTQTPTYIDEFAEFPGVLTAGQIANLFYTTKWYQALAPIPANPPIVIAEEDGCGDYDNVFMINMLIRAQQLGLVKLAGLESATLDGTSQAYYRQILDQAGLNQIPVSAPTGAAVGSGHCTSANITSYNASTPQVAANYETASTMYRTIFAAHPSTPIYIANGGPLDGVAQFIASPADSISSLTGAQLWTQNGNNGGFLAIQGVTCCGNYLYYTYPANQTVLANGSANVYGWYGTPQSGGPGPLVSRSGNDPTWLVFNQVGSDTRSCWDCLTAVQAMFPGTDPFGGGVTIAIGGSGTGYAASTPFTSTGGGTNCNVSGFMLSTGGVPSSIVGGGGQPNTTPLGIGYGCYTNASPPTIHLAGATGTGATLTATTTSSACQGVTASGTQVDIATSPCTNFYSEYPQYQASPGNSPLFTWFINSLVDPVTVGRPRVP